MGICQSQEEKERELKTKQIDRELMQSHLYQMRVIKLLLLGASESGKSTILKQMKILHNHGFTNEEREKQKSGIYNNTMLSMASLLHGMEKLGIQMGPSLEPCAQIVLDVMRRGDEWESPSEELTLAMKCLWADQRIREEVFPKGHEFQLPENCKYFLDALDRTFHPDYRPTELDILYSRIRTTGIIEVKFRMKDMDFRVFDVGGQRSERKKWIHCFEDTNSVIFVTAVSEFDQVLFEDARTNRMDESLRMFESVCNSRWFLRASMIVFLNKKDLFEEKIKRKSINCYFRDYKGPNTYDDQIKFIEAKFTALNNNPDKTIYTHQTCATDTNQIQLILDSVVDFLVQQNLQGCALY